MAPGSGRKADPKSKTRRAVRFLVDNPLLGIHAAARKANISHSALSVLLKRNKALPTCPVCSTTVAVGKMKEKELHKLGMSQQEFLDKLCVLAGVPLRRRSRKARNGNGNGKK